MQTVRRLDALRSTIARLRLQGGSEERATIALVPTMGALHAGHMALVQAARARATHVVVSIFVNPTQFGANEDFGAYPRQEAADLALCEKAGVAAVWAPEADEMYPAGDATRVRVAGVSEGLCGAARPGHFEGVATVVAKLFGQVTPDIALFGEKDWQQLAVIRRMAIDLATPVEVVGVPTVREPDGLALSSRNAYLDADARARAVALPDAMKEAIAAMRGGQDVATALAALRARIGNAGFGQVDYAELVDGSSLQPVSRPAAGSRLIVAAWLGRTRLIDNMPVF